MKIKKILRRIFPIGLSIWLGCSSSPPKEMTVVSRAPRIFPDYINIVIPPNIAPLNFKVEEPGIQYRVTIRGSIGPSIYIQTKSPKIQIPFKKWKKFLEANKGNAYHIEIASKDTSGEWKKFSPIVNQIALDSIDSYLAYRRLGPLYSYWKKMGIYQRCIESFQESPILINRLTQNNCMNCHHFLKNNSDRWLLHLRRGPGTAMLLVIDDKVYKMDTRTAFNKAPVAYPAWHPSGNLVAFSLNRLLLFFHAVGEPRDVLDRASDLVVYDIPTNTLTTTRQISNPDRMENWPAWSPDGKYLYFSSAPKIETYEATTEKSHPFAYHKIQYDLMRIPYDEKNKTWGKLEMVFPASKIGGSINQPRISPDGRFVLFTVSQYSNFPIYLSSADLYVLDLATNQVKKLESNSEYTDSFHAWSTNGKWIVFSSKRMDHVFARPYFAHIDQNGVASKAFILPQKNPEYYNRCLETFNVPEFVRKPVRVSAKRLAKAAYKKAVPVTLDPQWMPAKEKEEKPILSPQPQ